MATIRCINAKGKYHDDNAKHDVINYILNPDKMIHGYYGMEHVNPANPDLSMWDTSMSFGQEHGVRIRHYVVSFSKTELRNPMIAKLIADEVIKAVGGKFECIYGVHEDTDELHFHLAFNTVSYVDGSRFYGKKHEHYGIINIIKFACSYYGFIAYYVKNTNETD